MFGKADTIEHFKLLLDEDYTAQNIFHEVLMSYVQVVHENTKAHVHTLSDFKESWGIHIEEIWIWYMLKSSMTMEQLPAKVDYWKTGQAGAVVYPNYGMWMNKTRFGFIKKNLWLVNYDRLTAERTTDKMWK
eukprot:1150375-Ditylum_brightwellii.AAC.1